MSIANDVRVAVYRSFIETTRAPMASDIASVIGATVGEVLAGLRELDDQDVIALQPGTDLIWLAHPFCAVDAPFQVATQGRTWDAICIWDALGVLAVLDSDGRVTTSCPDCGDGLRVPVHRGDVVGVERHVVHYEVPAANWYDDIAHT
jgi:hypothetical protein